jgi:hypothetical protein
MIKGYMRTTDNGVPLVSCQPIEGSDIGEWCRTIPSKLGIQEFYCWSKTLGRICLVISRGKCTAKSTVNNLMAELDPSHLWWSIVPFNFFEIDGKGWIDLKTNPPIIVDLTGLGDLIQEARLKAFLYEPNRGKDE